MRYCTGTALLLLGSLSAAEPTRQLAIVNPTLRQYEGGPPISPGETFSTGDTIFFTFQIRGYQASPESKMDLLYRVEAQDPDGVRLAEPVKQQIQGELSPQDKDWMPTVRQSVEIPPLALPGIYRVLIEVEDRLAKREAKTQLDIPIRGRKVEPSQALVVRNFRFLRSEEDRDPLRAAVYRPGDAVWARFEITGFRYGDNNRIHVEYDISVVGPSGKVMFTQPQAAVEQGESLYPKKYLPGVLSLNMDRKVTAGEYAIVLTLRDQVGNQAQESRHEFRVE
jgi:hypothetical protein